MNPSHPEPMQISELPCSTIHSDRYAKCIEASKRVRWEIERDVVRGRSFEFDKHFLPDGLSRIARLDFLSPGEQRLLSQVQGRTYANMFGLVERFIGIKMLELSREHWYGDQVALEAVVRFSDEELKHQALFRRIEALAGAGMPVGYTFVPRPNAVAAQVLQASSWAVLALTCHIELFTQVHYRLSIAPEGGLSELYQDVFLHHWMEESQHAIVDELEWAREDARLTEAGRDQAVDELIALVGAVDGLLQAQAAADTQYFLRSCGRALAPPQAERLAAGLLDAYRWQYIVSGVQNERFAQLLRGMLNAEQNDRVSRALAPLLHSQ